MVMFTRDSLPPVINGTDGYLVPKPEGTTAACVAPVAANWPYPANWGKPEGSTMPVKPGQWVTCLGVNDSYLNAQFPLTCSLTGRVLDPESDPRAAEIDEFWTKRHGLKVLIVESRKTVGAIVVGEVAPEAVGKDITTREGSETLATGDLVLVCPRSGDLYRITLENRKKRYAENGKVFKGKLPSEYC
jgi:hypothetical protein